MKMSNKLAIGAALIACCATGAAAFDHRTWPDGRKVLVVQTNAQEDLSSLKSGVRGRATDRRFRTNEAMFLANEIYLSGTEFFLRASAEGLPIAHDRQFSFLTNVEAYWYSRYNLLSASARARVGIGVIHGPYLDLLAQEATGLNRFGHSRGELAFSNKDMLLTRVIASFLSRSGLPQKFDNAVPLMLEFKSGNAHFIHDIDLAPDAEGRASYLDDFETLLWSHDGMDTTIDMGGVGQALLKKVLWAKFFLRRNHTDVDFPGEVFLGNNAEDGFRGPMLTLEAVSSMLFAKAALFADEEGRVLSGINPVGYDPKAELRYLPHEIRPTLIFTGDMPVRQHDLAIKDATSRLWDQASWLWATTEFFEYANPRLKDNWDRVFGYQTPFDGSVMEQKYSLLARSLANTLLANLEAMHMVDGILVSDWSPKRGPGGQIGLSDLSLAVSALASYAKRMDLDPETQQHAIDMARRQAEFLLKAADGDGSYRQSYDVAGVVAHGERDMTSQAFAIRALIEAYGLTGDVRYADAARGTSATWNREFWDDAAWLYRNDPANTHVTYTPRDVAATLAALREMILLDHDAGLLDRFKKFFVQGIDASGLMQSEDLFTGEDIEQVRAGHCDSDGDGIPFLNCGHGAHGIDSVFASRVEFDVGAPARRPVVAPPAAMPATGEAIYGANCAVCHGDRGAGNEGPRLANNSFVQLTGHNSVAQTVAQGRLSVGMPAWGKVLAEDEINKVVEYIRALDE